MYGLQHVVEIKADCHFPRTKTLYTFVGFRLRLHVKQAINNQQFLKVPKDRQFYFYNCDSDHLNYEDFQPSKGFYYIYFTDPLPTHQSMKNVNQDIFNLKKVAEIQRCYYFPSTHNLYTFLGFSTLLDVQNAMNNDLFKAFLGSTTIHLYNFGENDIKTKSAVFVPLNDVFYIYVSEPLFLNSHRITSTQFSGLQNVVDIQSCVYLPSSQSIYTFIGFVSLNDVQNALDSRIFRDNPSNKIIHFYNIPLQYQEFKPISCLYYVYFRDLAISFRSRLFDDGSIYAMNSIADIQQSVYFPRTKDIYTFVGFQTIKDTNSALKLPQFRSNADNGKIFYYNFTEHQLKYTFIPTSKLFYIFFKETTLSNIPLKVANSQLFCIPVTVEYQRNYFLPHTNETYLFVGFKSLGQAKTFINSYTLRYPNVTINYYNFASSDLNYDDFYPTKSLYYIYFVESRQATASQKYFHKSMFGLISIPEIAKSYYLLGTKRLVTFVGFRELKDIKNALSNQQFMSIPVGRKIEYYNFTERELKYTFDPTEGLFYLYFQETNAPNQPQKSFNTQYFGIPNIVEYQRNFYFPHTTKLYTFIGFKLISQAKVFITTFKRKLPRTQLHFYGLDIKDLQYDEFSRTPGLYYLYFRDKHPATTSLKSVNQSIYGLDNAVEIRQSFLLPQTNKRYTFIGFKRFGEINIALQNKTFRSMPADGEIHYYNFSEKELKLERIFQPTKDLFYIYFKESIPPNISVFSTKHQWFGLSNDVEYQGHFIYPQDHAVYTFVGFKSLDDINLIRNNSEFMKNVRGQISCYNFTSQDLCYSDFHPKNDMYYIYFIDLMPAHASKIATQSIPHPFNMSIEIHSSFHYPNTNRLYTFIGFDTLSNAEKALSENTFPPIPNLLRDQIFFFNIKLQFCEFECSNDLYYVYFVDSGISIRSRKFVNTSMFGLENVAEVQRSFYYPKTMNLFTFVGFKSISEINIALSNPAFRSLPKDGQIHNYNFSEFNRQLQSCTIW